MERETQGERQRKTGIRKEKQREIDSVRKSEERREKQKENTEGSRQQKTEKKHALHAHTHTLTLRWFGLFAGVFLCKDRGSSLPQAPPAAEPGRRR